MAGSFGYEGEHAATSHAIAKQRLLPKLAKADNKARIVANGFSCRHQIAEFTGREAKHVIEVVRDYVASRHKVNED